MIYQHGIYFAMHLVFYFFLYPFLKKMSLFTVGIFVLAQFLGVDLIVLALIKSKAYFLSLGFTLILCPFLISYLSRGVTLYIEGKKYAGLQQYLLLVDTDLKYIIGLYGLSLLINLYFNPLPGLLNYTNLTVIAAFLLSVPLCKKMNKLKEDGKKRGQATFSDG
jgi:hypothetical protein